MEEGFEAEPHSHPTMYESYYVLEGRVVPPGAVHRQCVTRGPHRVFYWGIAV